MDKSKIARRTVAVFIVFPVIVGLLTAPFLQDAANKNTDYLGNGSRNVLVENAKKELETYNTANLHGGDKYRKWYTGHADGQAWCATYVSYIAQFMSGIDTNVIPKYAACTSGVEFFKKQDVFNYTTYYGGKGYTPQAGDIIFYNWNHVRGNSVTNKKHPLMTEKDWACHHTGIVIACKDGQVVTIEGNRGNKVKEASTSVSNPDILGYASPKYPDSIVSLTGTGNTEQTWNYLKSAGFGNAANAGIIGNLTQESNINPKSGYHKGVNDVLYNDSKSVGLCQWLGGRKAKLYSYANSQGKKWYDLDVQLSYMIQEMNSYSWKNEFMKKNKESEIESATTIFCNKFERPGMPMLGKRISYAQSAYSKFANGKTSNKKEQGGLIK